jgi:antitoxin HicB
MKSKTYEFTVVFEPADEGGFIASCPALPGCVIHGGTLEEARAMAIEAVQGYLESLTKNGEPIPPDVEPIKEKIHVAIPTA